METMTVAGDVVLKGVIPIEVKPVVGKVWVKG
jgi:hypothetical protein